MKYLKNKSFFQGLAVGLFITSTLSYGVVTLNTFTSGTTISATEMNANFAAIKAKLDSLDVGSVGKLNSNMVVTCLGTYSATYPTDYSTIPMMADSSDGNFNNTTHVYTIPETALYRIYLNAPSEDSMGYNSTTETSTDGGSTWALDGNTIKKYVAGTLIRATAGCGTNYAGTDSTIVSSAFLFAIKKF